MKSTYVVKLLMIQTILILTSLFDDYQLFAQGNLVLVGPQSYTKTFTKQWGRHAVDTIVVPAGHIFKIENAALGQITTWNGGTYIETCPHYAIEVGDNLLYVQNQSQTNSYHSLFQQSSVPMWIGPGSHVVYFNTGFSQTFTSKLSIHGLLFSLQ